ncbi:hypothetical protein KKG31_05585 [Patescibacteria group bacterium]|nr:hypothetical protein [Patescibacteria group bacterium]MBU1758579.1 hypothetical protein [Patescibacteria group bacterium]
MKKKKTQKTDGVKKVRRREDDRVHIIREKSQSFLLITQKDQPETRVFVERIMSRPGLPKYAKVTYYGFKAPSVKELYVLNITQIKTETGEILYPKQLPADH